MMNQSFLVFLLSLICLSSGAQGGDGERILNQHMNKMGQEFWDQIQDVIIKGKWVNEDYKAWPVTITLKSPGKIRIEGTWQGKRFVEATDGVIPWMIAPWSASPDITAADPVERVVLAHVLTIGSPLAGKGVKPEFAGLVSYEGTLYHTFRHTEGNMEVTYYLSRDTDLIIYKEVKAEFPNQSLLLTFHYEKYKDYSGMLKVPTAVRISGDNFYREYIFDDFSVGLGAADNLFRQPD